MNNSDSEVARSIEDHTDHQNSKMLVEMGKCRNLDYFYDVVFELDGRHRIMANSAVLLARCEYFRIMFDSKYSFKENSAEEAVRGRLFFAPTKIKKTSTRRADFFIKKGSCAASVLIIFNTF